MPKGNGGVGPNYEWTQTFTELTVHIPLHQQQAKAKDVSCSFTKTSVCVRVGSQVVVAGDWPVGESVVPSECCWSFDAGVVVLEVQKSRENWWPSVVRGHPEVDMTQIDSTKRVSEFDEETQREIRKVIVQNKLG